MKQVIWMAPFDSSHDLTRKYLNGVIFTLKGQDIRVNDYD
jgi:hypothetical protein